jgi:hypothetical protein
MKDVIDFLLARASEPSSYAGLAGILSGIHLTLTGTEFNAVVGVLTAIAGLAGVFLKEKGYA